MTILKKRLKPKANSFENTSKMYKTKIREDTNKLKQWKCKTCPSSSLHSNLMGTVSRSTDLK